MGIVATGIALGCSLSQAQAAGTLDTTFGSNGIVTTSLGSGVTGSPMGAFEESNGDILVVVEAFEASEAGTNSVVEILRYTPQGQLDTTFGTDGVVTTTIPNLFVLTDVALDAEGRFVIPGKATNSSGAEGIGAARLTANGQLDTTFGTGGVVTTFLTHNVTSTGAFLLQPNGQILMAAGEQSVVIRQPGTDVLVRYDSNGTLDSTFGTGGIEDTGGVAGALALLANGDYLFVSGSTIAELSSTGAGLSSFTSSAPTAASPFFAIQSNGDMVETSSILPPGTPPSRGGHQPSDVNVARVTENGTADSTFTTTTFTFEAITSANSLDVNVNFPAFTAFNSAGQIIVAGGVSGTGSSADAAAGVARLNEDGGLDTTFGVGGTATSNALMNEVQALLVESNGNIVVAGAPPSSSSEVASSIVLERFLGN